MSMTAKELGFELSQMIEDARYKEKVIARVLFGIKYADELEDVRAADVIGWAPEVGTGKKLARYVTLK